MSASRRFLACHGVTLLLVVFCAAMTALLVRSELFPESSWVRRLPPEIVLARVLRGDSQSTLTLWWKGERVGAGHLRVFPGNVTRLHGLVDGYVPVLGKHHPGRIEVDCAVALPRELQTLRLRGKVEDASVEILADAARNTVRWSVRGGGMDESHEAPLREMAAGGIGGLKARLPGLPKEWGAPNAGALAQAARAWKVYAANTRIQRREKWMDAFLVEARLDANSWARLWVSPTGELLKLESSFGLRALNEDFFQL